MYRHHTSTNAAIRRTRRARNTEANLRRRRHDAALAQAVGDQQVAATVRSLITQIDLADGSVISKATGGRPQFFFLLSGRVVLSDTTGPIAVLPEATVFGDAPRSTRSSTNGVQALALGPVTLGVASEREFDAIVDLVPALAHVRGGLAAETATPTADTASIARMLHPSNT